MQWKLSVSTALFKFILTFPGSTAGQASYLWFHHCSALLNQHLPPNSPVCPTSTWFRTSASSDGCESEETPLWHHVTSHIIPKHVTLDTATGSTPEREWLPLLSASVKKHCLNCAPLIVEPVAFWSHVGIYHPHEWLNPEVIFRKVLKNNAGYQTLLHSLSHLHSICIIHKQGPGATQPK